MQITHSKEALEKVQQDLVKAKEEAQKTVGVCVLAGTI